MAQRLILFLLIIFSFSIVLIHNIYILASIDILLTILSLVFNTNKFITRIKVLLIFGISILLFQIIFNSQASLVTRLYLSLVSILKIYAISLTTFIYITFTPPIKIIRALSFLPENAKLMTLVTFSLIPAMETEFNNIYMVQISRGFSGGGWNIFRKYLPIIIPLLHRIFLRAEKIALNLEVKGYGT